MDRNTITGLVVIALILIGYSYFMSPSKEELKAMHVRDSIARVEAQRAAALEKERQADFVAQQQILKHNKRSKLSSSKTP